MCRSGVGVEQIRWVKGRHPTNAAHPRSGPAPSASQAKDLQSSGFDMAAVAARLVRLIQMLKIDPTKPVGALGNVWGSEVGGLECAVGVPTLRLDCSRKRGIACPGLGQTHDGLQRALTHLALRCSISVPERGPRNVAGHRTSRTRWRDTAHYAASRPPRTHLHLRTLIAKHRVTLYHLVSPQLRPGATSGRVGRLATHSCNDLGASFEFCDTILSEIVMNWLAKVGPNRANIVPNLTSCAITFCPISASYCPTSTTVVRIRAISAKLGWLEVCRNLAGRVAKSGLSTATFERL